MTQLEKKGKFACIGHPTDMDLYRSYILHLKPDKIYNDQLILKLFEWTPSYKVKELYDLSIDGKTCSDGIIIMVPILPEMRDIKLKEVTAKIEQAIALAAREKCAIAALGGFTSIVLQGQEKDLAEKYNIKLTSGNTLTAAVIIRSIMELCARFELSLADQTIAIIGASGDIGSGCTLYFCDKVKKLILTARGLPSLQELEKKLNPLASCQIETVTENAYAVKSASIIIFVTSAYRTLFHVNYFIPGTIICDASAPQNVHCGENPRNDVFLYHGGILKIPGNLNPGFDVGLPSTDTFYGCQLEGILIAQDPALPYSWGRGNISREKIDIYLQCLKTNPLLETAFTIRNKVYTDQEMRAFASRLKK